MRRLVSLPLLASCLLFAGCSLFQPANAAKTADKLDQASAAISAGAASTANPLIIGGASAISAVLGAIALYARHRAADAAFDEGAAAAAAGKIGVVKPPTT